jgi:halogenation protein CepH
MAEQVDVVIVGGGPGGATTAALLAQRGYQVLVLERVKFPRYHIGESLVPGILPVLDELGLRDEVERFGFVKKNGITLAWGAEREPWTVRFGEAGPIDHAWEVTRADFDTLLLQHARRTGATVIEQARVTDYRFEDGRCVGVTYSHPNEDEQREVVARHVVDATGQAHMLARKQGLIEWEESLKNVAVWTYFQGGLRYEGVDAGNILVENTPDGWLWVIPLHDGTQSVGWVAPVANVRERDTALGELLLRRIESSTETKRLLAPARRVSGFHTTRDWSYKCSRFHGPGFTLVGDAAGFVDPLFSTGVFLAMNGARLAVQAIDDLLRSPGREAEYQAGYERSYREFLDTVLSFVKYFYDASRSKESYWAQAQTLVDPIGQMTARQDFVHLISGLAGIRPVMRPNAEITELAA